MAKTSEPAKFSSKECRVQGYLHPKYYLMFKGFTESEALNESQAINKLINDFFKRLPVNAQQNYIDLGKEVLQQKRKPSKNSY
jgi:hypothetical protein